MSFFKSIFGRPKGRNRPRATQPKVSSGTALKMSADDAYRQGQSCAAAGDWKSAAKYFETATRLESRSAPAFFSLAIAYLKAQPPGMSEETLRLVMLKFCSLMERAVALAEKYGGLSDKHYRQACLQCGSIHRLGRRYDKAVRYLRMGLKRSPDDPEFLEGLAITLIEKGDPSAAEEAVNRLLTIRPGSDQARKLWKRIRQGLGKSIGSDLPEDKKKRIYFEYEQSSESRWLTKDLAADMKAAGSLSESWKNFNEATARAKQDAAKAVAAKYGLSPFELQLILQEGQRKSWPRPTIGGADAPPPREQFRDSLVCQHCGKRNTAGYWPEAGDRVAFYYQEEPGSQKPESFSLPITCPFCNKVWYVVWDADIDPAAGPILRHIERMCNAPMTHPATAKALRAMISDKILGKYSEIIRAELPHVAKRSEVRERKFVEGTYLSILTLVPSAAPDGIREYLGGSYLAYLESCSHEWDKEKHQLAHWVLGCDGERLAAHLMYVPAATETRPKNTYLPVDLLTFEERQMFGV